MAQSQTWREPYVPGQGEAGSATRLRPLRCGDRDPVDALTWLRARDYLCGLALYEFGYFWEAHEVWEPVWLRCAPNSRERQTLAGLIQLANGCLKLRMGRARAAGRLAAEAARLFGEAGQNGAGRVLGVEVVVLASAAMAFRSTIEGAGGRGLEALLAHRPEVTIAAVAEGELATCREAVRAICRA